MAQSGYEDLRLVKMLLDTQGTKAPDSRSQELILFGASLEALRTLNEKVDKMHEKLHDHAPKSNSTEKSLIDQIKELNPQERATLLEILSPQPEPSAPSPEPEPSLPYNNIDMPSIFESVSDRKKVLIKTNIEKYGKITSSQLAKIIGLSRTRCNEYLKEMELAGELTAYTEDKKRYYHIKN